MLQITALSIATSGLHAPFGSVAKNGSGGPRSSLCARKLGRVEPAIQGDDHHMKKSTLLKAGAAPLAISLALVSAPAFAQVADGPPPEDTTVNADGSDEDRGAIVVTGSRIARPDLNSVSPVTIVDSEQVELTGTVTLETLLNDLPSVIPGNNRTSNNSGGFAFSTLDLRGLGPQRTLILVDGERLPASSASGVVDIAQIPTGLIERVDVVTGGATAVYGSDAISGVVNFILKDNFEGLELTAQAGVAEEGVGFNMNVQGLFGGNFDDGRGNLSLFASYFDREAVSQGRFDYSRTSAAIYREANNGRIYVVDDPSDIIAGSTPFFAGGSATAPWGEAVNSAANPFNIAALSVLYPNTVGAGGTPAGCTPNGSNLSFNDSGALTRYYGGGLCSIPLRGVGSSRYNFAPDNFLAIPYNRFNMSTIGSYEFSDDTRLRVYAAYTNTNSEVNLAPTPAAGGTGFVIDPTRAVLIPQDLRDALNSRPNPDATFSFNRRFSETGPRIGLTESQNIVGRTTLEHDLSSDWTVDATLSWGRSDLTSTAIGNINRVAVEQGINGCRNDGGVVGGPGILPGCVPVNIFGPNTLTPAMVRFIQTNTVDTQEFEQVRAAVNLAGSFFELPGGPIGLAVGAEVRTDRGLTRPDDAKIRGEIIGFNQQQPTAGEITAREVYGEMRLPLLGGGGFPDLLAVELGARLSDYSSIGDIFNWKAAVEFAPVSWLRFRAAYNKAARAPSVFELFQAGDQGFPSYTDPCNATNTGRNAAFCQAQGVPAAALPTFAQNNSQVQAFAFGQSDLQEEKAETYTAGVVIQPDWFPLGRLSLTADYYDITIRGRIQALSAQFYINGCNTSANLTSDACSRVFRNPATGQIDRVNTGRQNSPDDGGPFETRGIDAGLNWVVPVGEIFGGNSDARIRIAELFNYTIAYKLGGTDFVDTGSGGLASVIPEFNNTLTVGYEDGPFTGQVRWIYKSGGEQAGQIFAASVPVDRIPDLSYFDLSLRFNVSDNFTLTGIVNNLFDKFPTQTVGGAIFEQANANVSLFSPLILGRSYTVQAQVRF